MNTIGSLLPPAVRQLAAAGSTTPTLDVQLWLAHVCGLSRTQVLAHPERPLTPEQSLAFYGGLERLLANEPLPYLTGQVEFYGRRFRVTPATLIPRPETEHLIYTALELMPTSPQAGPLAAPDYLVADIGTGSGCIGVTLAAERAAVHVLAVDIDPDALEVAIQNAHAHNVSGRMTFLQGDLLEPLLSAQRALGLSNRVHLIAANLPYIADDEWADLPASVREFEPTGALRGGSDGLDLIRRLLRNAPAVLQPGGTILLEIGAAQGKFALALARARFPAAQSRLVQDYGQRDRLLVIQTAS